MIFLPDTWTILLCFLVWLVLQVSAALVCLNLPDRFFSPDSFFFRSHRFENGGRIYNTIFLVKRWKHLLPDGGNRLEEKRFQKEKTG